MSNPIYKAGADGGGDHTYISAHGTAMVIAWMVFASTAILFARYGRSMRFGSKEKLLGEIIWFQVHRFAACMATVTTLLGFFLILVQTNSFPMNPILPQHEFQGIECTLIVKIS